MKTKNQKEKELKKRYFLFFTIISERFHDTKIKTRAYKGNDEGILTHVSAKLFIRERRSNF